MDDDAEFTRWYAAYPRKVAPLKAKQAYRKARKLATADELLDGVARYIKTKPAYADWAHPASWLNAGRWLDDVGGPVVIREQGWDCPHVERCSHQQMCEIAMQLGRPRRAEMRK